MSHQAYPCSKNTSANWTVLVKAQAASQEIRFFLSIQLLLDCISSTVSSCSFPSTKKSLTCWTESSSMQPKRAGLEHDTQGQAERAGSVQHGEEKTVDRTYSCLQIPNRQM